MKKLLSRSENCKLFEHPLFSLKRFIRVFTITKTCLEYAANSIMLGLIEGGKCECIVQNFSCPPLCLPFLVNDNAPLIESVQTIIICDEAVSVFNYNYVFCPFCKVSYSRCKLCVVGLTFTFFDLVYFWLCILRYKILA